MSDRTLSGPPDGGSAPPGANGAALYSRVLGHNSSGPPGAQNVAVDGCSGPSAVFTAASLAQFRADVASGAVVLERSEDPAFSRPEPRWASGGPRTGDATPEENAYAKSVQEWLGGGWTTGQPLPKVERPADRVAGADESWRKASRATPGARRAGARQVDPDVGPAERTVDFRERLYEWDGPLPAGHRVGLPRPWDQPGDEEILSGAMGADDVRDLPLQLPDWQTYRAAYGLAGPSIKSADVYARHVALERYTMLFRAARHHALAYGAYLATQGKKWRKGTPEECERAGWPIGSEKRCGPGWYEDRANGQAARFAKTVSCGDDEISYACPSHGCSCAGISRVGCSVGRVCVPCRAKQAKKRQARFGEARISVLDDLARDYPALMRPRNPDRYSEKFLTLTLPDAPIDPLQLYPDAVRRRVAKGLGVSVEMLDLRLKQSYGDAYRIVALRIDVLFRAWRHFTVELYRYLERERARMIGMTPTGYRKARKKRRTWERAVLDEAETAWRSPKGPLDPVEAVKAAEKAWHPPLVLPPENVTLPPFHLYRSFEWTVGNGNIGHPHFHVWMLGPKLPGQVPSADRKAHEAALAAWGAEDPATRGPMPTPPAILMREWWRRALRKAGMSVADDADLVFNLKELKQRSGRDIRAELIKAGGKNLQYDRAARLEFYGSKGEDAVKYADGWCVVDRNQTGEAPPEMLARAYEALEGRRLTQASAGFLARAVSASKSGCRVHNERLQTRTYPGGAPDGVRSAIESRQRARE